MLAQPALDVEIVKTVKSLAVCICQILLVAEASNFADFVLTLKRFQALEELMVVPSPNLRANELGDRPIGLTEQGQLAHNGSSRRLTECAITSRNLMWGYI
jgi:hypothetical protein